jgi:hypothetical protein
MDLGLIPTWYQPWLREALASKRNDKELVEELTAIRSTFDQGVQRLSLWIERLERPGDESTRLDFIRTARDHAAEQVIALTRAIETVRSFVFNAPKDGSLGTPVSVVELVTPAYTNGFCFFRIKPTCVHCRTRQSWTGEYVRFPTGGMFKKTITVGELQKGWPLRHPPFRKRIRASLLPLETCKEVERSALGLFFIQ